MIFYSVYIDITQDSFLDWKNIDFLIFFLITNFSVKLKGLMFFWGFTEMIKKGRLNMLLTKPISVYYQIITSALKTGRLFTGIIVFTILTTLLTLSNYTNYFSAFII